MGTESEAKREGSFVTWDALRLRSEPGGGADAAECPVGGRLGSPSAPASTERRPAAAALGGGSTPTRIPSCALRARARAALREALRTQMTMRTPGQIGVGPAVVQGAALPAGPGGEG